MYVLGTNVKNIKSDGKIVEKLTLPEVVRNDYFAD